MCRAGGSLAQHIAQLAERPSQRKPTVRRVAIGPQQRHQLRAGVYAAFDRQVDQQRQRLARGKAQRARAQVDARRAKQG
jgi:hypothetical protein